ncbi:reverse transcriptase domain-containing protein [Tanacetum coccineum]
MDYQCTQSEEIERQREYERLEIAREKSMQEFTDTFKEFLERLNIQRKEEEKQIFEEAARQEEEKRIAKEKEAAELEAKRKIQECFNIEEKSIPQVSTRSRKSRIDPTLSNFKISTKRIPLSNFEIPPVTPNVETVNSLSMGDKHLDTSKDSLESMVKDPVPIPSESNDTSNGTWNSLFNDDKFQKALNDWCNLAQQNSMLSIYDENNKIRDCYKLSPSVITPDLPIPNPLIMEDEHLDTIPVTESANSIKSSVEDLVPTPSESADLSDGEIIIEEEIQKDEFKYFSNPLYDLDDEIITNEKILPNQKDLDVDIPIPPGIDKHCFNAESDLLESLLNRDSPIDSTKIDSIFDEFSLPRPPEESNSEYSDATIESLFPSPIPVEDSDSLMEEIDLFLASDDSMPPGIEDDDYDSEGDIRFLEELLSSDSPPLPENESFSLDHFDDPSLPRPPPEPPDVEICFNFEPDAGVVTKKVVGDISEHDVLMPNLLPTNPPFVQCLTFCFHFHPKTRNYDVTGPQELRTCLEILELPGRDSLYGRSQYISVRKRILERTVGENRASWSDKLEDALWAFSTAFKTPIGCTPYKLMYEKACHLPIEFEHKAYWALKHCNFDLKTAGDHRKVQMNVLNELCDQAYENSLIYKEKTKKIHDSKIKNHIFNVGDRVLLFNSRLKIFLGKLKTRWTGPFTVTQVFPYGTIELSSTN